MRVYTTEAERGKERKMDREELIELVLNMTDEKAKELRKSLENDEFSRSEVNRCLCWPS